MKKFILFLFTLVIGFAVFCEFYVKADPAPTVVLQESAEISRQQEVLKQTEIPDANPSHRGFPYIYRAYLPYLFFLMITVSCTLPV